MEWCVCVSSCLPGEMWVTQDAGFEMIAENTEKGRCVTCPLGKSSDVGSWECQNLPSGQYGEGLICPFNTYSEGGTVECTDCPSGKYSDAGASKCIECDFMYRLSTHCEVPVSGILLTLSILIVIVVLSLLFRRYRKQQKSILRERETELGRISDRFAVAVEEVDKLAKDNQRLEESWLLQWEDVKLEGRLARGGYGEVWRGRYRGRWDVAVKKMFDTDDIDTLADESEIHFLQRARHPRLVLFMGAGRMPDRNLFLVLEYVWCGVRIPQRIQKCITHLYIITLSNTNTPTQIHGGRSFGHEDQQ